MYFGTAQNKPCDVQHVAKFQWNTATACVGSSPTVTCAIDGLVQLQNAWLEQTYNARNVVWWANKPVWEALKHWLIPVAVIVCSLVQWKNIEDDRVETINCTFLG